MSHPSFPSWTDIQFPELDPTRTTDSAPPLTSLGDSFTHTPAVWLGTALLHLLVGPAAQVQQRDQKAETSFVVGIVAEKVA